MHHLLKKIIEINDVISTMADSLQWDQALALTNKRDIYLRQYFELNPQPDDNSIVSKTIEDMTNSDQKISDMIARAKSELINESLSLKNSHAAIKQYHHTQSE